MLINQRESAINSNREEEASGRKVTQCQRVLDCFNATNFLNDRELSELTGIDIARIPDRRGKLLKKGLLTEFGVLHDIRTSKLAMNWKLNPTPEIVFKRKSAQQKTFEIKQLCRSSDSELAKKILSILSQ